LSKTFLNEKQNLNSVGDTYPFLWQQILWLQVARSLEGGGDWGSVKALGGQDPPFGLF